MAIWVIKDGQREGPYEEQDVRELIYEGTYSDADPAISDGQYDWSTIGQILGHEPAEESPPLPPVAELQAEEEALAAEPPPMPGAAPEAPEPGPAAPMPVTVVDFQMPMGSMVVFMIKWMLACIPALIVLGVIAAVVFGVCMAVLSLVSR